jgi:hypothetical protein
MPDILNSTVVVVVDVVVVVVVVPATVLVVVAGAVVVVVARTVVVVSLGPMASHPAMTKPKAIIETRNTADLILLFILFPLQ